MRIEGSVGLKEYTEGQDGQPFAQGRDGQLYVDEVHGRHYAVTKKGRLFIGSTAAAGVALPIITNVAQVFGIWNPLGSGVDAELVKLRVGSVGTNGAAGNIVYAYQLNVGAGPATGAPITAVTRGTPVNGYLGGGQASKVIFIPATVTFTTAPSLLRPMGVTQAVLTFTDATMPRWSAWEDFKGDIIIPPGVIFVVCGNAALTTVDDLGLVWAEHPV